MAELHGFCLYAHDASLVLCAVSIVRGATALRAHHAGADGVLGRTLPAKKRALGWCDAPAKYIAAATSLWLNGLFDFHLKAACGVECREVVPYAQSRLRDGAQPAPDRVAGLKDLIDECASDCVALRIYTATVCILDGGFVPFDHVDEHGDALQDIDGLKTRDNAGDAELIDKEPVRLDAGNGRDVSGKDERRCAYADLLQSRGVRVAWFCGRRRLRSS